MPRELSGILTQAKNQTSSTDPFVWCLEVSSPDFPVPLRFVNDVQSLIFQGITYLPFPFDLSAVQENSLAEKQSLSITVANVDQQVISTLNQFWDAVSDPAWQVRLWQVLRSNPDEVASSDAEVFEVMSVDCDLLVATFELQQLGIPSRQRSTGRRYVVSAGFPHIPRVGRLFA